MTSETERWSRVKQLFTDALVLDSVGCRRKTLQATVVVCADAENT